jgi:hypothetical protein
MKLIDKDDLCKSCEHYWQDFPMPLDRVVSHCEVLDRKGSLKEMNDVVPYPCLKCPFDSFNKKD